MTLRPAVLVSVALFIALGLVGAFIVSAVADRGGHEPVETSPAALDPGLEDPSAVRVEVLNGAGTAGLAREATHHLRGAGFDVVFFGNARRFDHTRSVVIDRVGHAERARAVAAALQVDSVHTAVDSSLMLDVTVVLGRDWPPEPPPELHWSDRFLDAVGWESPADSAAAAPATDTTADSAG